MLSEQSKNRPDENVLRFFRSLRPGEAHISVLSLGELHRGITQWAKRDIVAAGRLQRWVSGLEQMYADRILDVDRGVARTWGELSADRSRPPVDTLLAATALHYGLTLATCNVRDFEGLPVRLVNPWATS